MLKYLGNTPVPRGIVKYTAGIGREFEPAFAKKVLRQNGVYTYGYKHEDIPAALRPMLAGVHFTEHCFMDFRSVEEHTDDWEDVKIGGQKYAPAFWTYVLRGEFRLRVGKFGLERTFKKGDIFVLDPNVPHEAITDRLCTVLSATVARKDFL